MSFTGNICMLSVMVWSIVWFKFVEGQFMITKTCYRDVTSGAICLIQSINVTDINLKIDFKINSYRKCQDYVYVK